MTRLSPDTSDGEPPPGGPQYIPGADQGDAFNPISDTRTGDAYFPTAENRSPPNNAVDLIRKRKLEKPSPRNSGCRPSTKLRWRLLLEICPAMQTRRHLTG
jgi:hypothetical protein